MIKLTKSSPKMNFRRINPTIIATVYECFAMCRLVAEIWFIFILVFHSMHRASRKKNWPENGTYTSIHSSFSLSCVEKRLMPSRLWIRRTHADPSPFQWETFCSAIFVKWIRRWKPNEESEEAKNAHTKCCGIILPFAHKSCHKIFRLSKSKSPLNTWKMGMLHCANVPEAPQPTARPFVVRTICCSGNSGNSNDSRIRTIHPGNATNRPEPIFNKSFQYWLLV